MSWSLLLALLIRSSIVLVAGEGVRRMCRQSGPAVRFRIRMWAAGSLAILPLLSACLPEIQMPLWHQAGGRAMVTVTQTLFIAGHGKVSVSVNWMLVAWLSGVAIALAPAVAGMISIWRIKSRSVRVCEEAWTGLLDELRAKVGLRGRPVLLKAAGVRVPVTFGLTRPHILLPADCDDWSDTRRRAVLLHELAHIRRHDVLAQACVHMTAAFWWFQPLVWELRRGIRHESELACDAETVALGIRPSQYAAELLGIAKGLRRRSLLPGTAISMARHGGLERRVALILNPQPVFQSSGRLAIAMITLAIAALAASALTVGPKQRFLESGGSPMKRTLISALLASAGLSAATVSGSISDITGGAIPDAKVVLYNPDTGTKQEATSSADGKFTIENAQAGNAILRVEKPGFSSLFREFDLQADSSVDRSLTMQVGPIEQQLTVTGQGKPQVTRLGPDRLRIGGAVEESHITQRKLPVYPASAKAAGIQGTVMLEAVISKEGVPQEIRVISSPSDDLSESTLEAVREWRYTSTLLNGNPVEVLTDIRVNYTLSQ